MGGPVSLSGLVFTGRSLTKITLTVAVIFETKDPSAKI
jgi:hypothetical protein